MGIATVEEGLHHSSRCCWFINFVAASRDPKPALSYGTLHFQLGCGSGRPITGPQRRAPPCHVTERRSNSDDRVGLTAPRLDEEIGDDDGGLALQRVHASARKTGQHNAVTHCVESSVSQKKRS